MAQVNALKKDIWEEDISNLFADDRYQLEDNLEDDLSEPSITIEEITRAIKSSNDKTVGPDLVSVELVMLLVNTKAPNQVEYIWLNPAPKKEQRNKMCKPKKCKVQVQLC